MLEERIVEGVESKGKLFGSLLKHPKIKEVRRIGLMFAVDFDSEERVQKIIKYALEHGIICFWFLSIPNSFRIAPPLTISEAEIKESSKIILEAIERS
jgi:4-aminobutyrate aminotransferase-like enzyme